jgi:hypothetical protein
VNRDTGDSQVSSPTLASMDAADWKIGVLKKELSLLICETLEEDLRNEGATYALIRREICTKRQWMESVVV